MVTFRSIKSLAIKARERICVVYKISRKIYLNISHINKRDPTFTQSIPNRTNAKIEILWSSETAVHIRYPSNAGAAKSHKSDLYSGEENSESASRRSAPKLATSNDARCDLDRLRGTIQERIILFDKSVMYIDPLY